MNQPTFKDKAASVLQLLRYGCACALVLAVKTGLMWVWLLVFLPLAAYFITYLFVILVSYLIHCYFSFSVKPGWTSFRAYFRAMWFFVLLDYLLFGVLFVQFEAPPFIALLSATVMVFFLRFFVVRRSMLQADG